MAAKSMVFLVYHSTGAYKPYSPNSKKIVPSRSVTVDDESKG